ncbi:MAG: sugar phosphate nucleotidyltransferase [Candidatus Moduliflexus flocculans]|nr:sugar phosphate nucleotidyltransferase [Candidatus Moduliflexus flocculans]
MVLCGGKGERLYPLTRDRAKPSVPFLGAYRIVDFSLSNALNSGLRRIALLTQYKSLSLDRHIINGWNIFHAESGDFIISLSAQGRVSDNWYEGTADAVFQNIYTIQQENPEAVLVLSGDHIYTADYRKLLHFFGQTEADALIMTRTIPVERGLAVRRHRRRRRAPHRPVHGEAPEALRRRPGTRPEPHLHGRLPVQDPGPDQGPAQGRPESQELPRLRQGHHPVAHRRPPRLRLHLRRLLGGHRHDRRLLGGQHGLPRAVAAGHPERPGLARPDVQAAVSADLHRRRRPARLDRRRRQLVHRLPHRPLDHRAGRPRSTRAPRSSTRSSSATPTSAGAPVSARPSSTSPRSLPERFEAGFDADKDARNFKISRTGIRVVPKGWTSE